MKYKGFTCVFQDNVKIFACQKKIFIILTLWKLKLGAIRGVRAGIPRSNLFAMAITAKVVFSLRQLHLPKNKRLSFAAVKQPPLPHSATEVTSILKKISICNLNGCTILARTVLAQDTFSKVKGFQVSVLAAELAGQCIH